MTAPQKAPPVRPPVRVPGASPGQPAPSAPPAPRRPFAPARIAGRAAARIRLRTRPSRLLAVAAVAVALVATLFAVSYSAFGSARDGLRVIGGQAGPQAVATANLYYALSDMDTQLANVLLNGSSATLGFSRDQSLGLYDSDRAAADNAAVEALRLTGGNGEARATVRDLLGGMGQYEQFAAQAIQLDEQSGHPSGTAPPAGVLKLHRQATDLMTNDLLPKAYNLTLDAGSNVRDKYENDRGAVLDGRWWVGLSGLATIVLLVLIQAYLSSRFRRLLNPALALATLVCLVFTVAAGLLLQAEAGHLKDAKVRGFDSVIALSRARAISNSMNGDESRYLLDPARADTYEQLYLFRAQKILYVSSRDPSAGVLADLPGYDRRVLGDIGPSGMPKTPMDGLLGEETRNVTLPGQRTVAERVLTGFRQFRQSDQRVRTLAERGDRNGAVDVRLGDSEGHTNVDFALYDLSLQSLVDIHQQEFVRSTSEGRAAISGWETVLPVTGLIVVALIVIGVRPRVAEYR